MGLRGVSKRGSKVGVGILGARFGLGLRVILASSSIWLWFWVLVSRTCRLGFFFRRNNIFFAHFRFHVFLGPTISGTIWLSRLRSRGAFAFFDGCSPLPVFGSALSTPTFCKWAGVALLSLVGLFPEWLDDCVVSGEALLLGCHSPSRLYIPGGVSLLSIFNQWPATLKGIPCGF